MTTTAAAQAFIGFGPNAVAWFEGLARDNTKAFFDRTRPQYEAEVRGPLEALLRDAAQEFGGTIKVFRQNRDIRFSRDKSPYKLNTYGLVMERPKTPTALYASISADGLYAGTGYYQMAADQLDRYRAAAADARKGRKLAALLADVQHAGLDIWGEQLKTVPRGYAKDHPHAQLLAYKDLVVGALLPPGPALRDRRAYEHCADTWRAAEPLVKWLDTHVGATTAPQDQRR